MEHASCLRIIEIMGSFDQLKLPTVTCAEAFFRRVMAIEWHYRELVKDGSRGSVAARPSVSGSASLTTGEFDFFKGGGKTQCSLLVVPALISYMSDEMKMEAAITRASRKKTEERLMASTGMTSGQLAGVIQLAADGAKDGEGAARRGRRRGKN